MHESALFLAVGFFAWTWLFDRQRFHWGAAIAGACLGALPMLPWLYSMLTEETGFASVVPKWSRPFELKFWTYWVVEPLGLGLSYSLNSHFVDFLAQPVLGGTRTWLVLMLHVVAALAGIVLLGRAGWLWWRGSLRLPYTSPASPTWFALGAALFGYGILLTLTGLPVHRHYLIVTFPLMYVWVASLALTGTGSGPGLRRSGRSVLAVLCVVQLLLTLSFLMYIHQRGGAPLGDYGVTYGAQGRGQ
jgi:hypothetical protein